MIRIFIGNRLSNIRRQKEKDVKWRKKKTKEKEKQTDNKTTKSNSSWLVNHAHTVTHKTQIT